MPSLKEINEMYQKCKGTGSAPSVAIWYRSEEALSELLDEQGLELSVNLNPGNLKKQFPGAKFRHINEKT